MIVSCSSSLSKVFKFINDNEHLSFDVETTGLNVRKDKIIGFGISNGEQGFYICHLEYDTNSDELIEKLSFYECVEVLQALQSKKLRMWNGSFDTRFTYHFFNVNLINSLYVEGMLAKHTVDEEQPFRLKDVAKALYGEDATEEQRLMKESIKANGGASDEFYKADLELMGKYCIQDCILTFNISDLYLHKINKEGLTSFFFKDEVMPLYKEVTIPMELKGVPVDVNGLKDAQSSITEDIENLEHDIQQAIKPLLDEFETWFLWKDYPPRRTGAFAQALAKYADLNLPKTASGRYSLASSHLEKLDDSIYKTYLLGGEYLPDNIVREIQLLMFDDSGQQYMFNLSSKHHLKKVFFDKLAEAPLTKTAKGNPQVNDDFLDEMSKKYEWVAKLQDYNKLNKIKGSYIDRILDKQEDGMFYPSFFQHRTVSGRFGSDMQQLPRPKEEGELSSIVLKYNNIIRKFFIAGEGYKFIDADYNSLEPHVFAHVSGDDLLKDIFRKGLDFYSTIAIKTEKLENVSADKNASNYLGMVNKPARQKAKAYCLGVPYGLSGYALALQLNLTTKQGDKLVEDYLNGFPDLKAWMERSFQDCITKGYVKSEAGRVRHMPSAPKIWYAHSKYILEPLKIWDKFHDNPKKYEQMKFLRKKLKNYINNSRNFQIQSLAASITNRACIAISRELKRLGVNGYICAQIHDQVVVRVPDNQAEKLRKTVQILMENAYKISLPLNAPAEIGDNFYDAH